MRNVWDNVERCRKHVGPSRHNTRKTISTSCTKTMETSESLELHSDKLVPIARSICSSMKQDSLWSYAFRGIQVEDRKKHQRPFVADLSIRHDEQHMAYSRRGGIKRGKHIWPHAERGYRIDWRCPHRSFGIAHTLTA